MAVAAELHFCIGPLQEPAGICRALLSPSGQLWCVSSPCLDGKCKNILVVCGDITLTRDFVASTAWEESRFAAPRQLKASEMCLPVLAEPLTSLRSAGPGWVWCWVWRCHCMSCVRAKALRLLAQQSTRAMFRDPRAGAEAEECCCAAEQCSMGSTAPCARALILPASAVLQRRRAGEGECPEHLFFSWVFFFTSDALLYSPQNCWGLWNPPCGIMPIIPTAHWHVSASTCHSLEMLYCKRPPLWLFFRAGALCVSSKHWRVMVPLWWSPGHGASGLVTFGLAEYLWSKGCSSCRSIHHRLSAHQDACGVRDIKQELCETLALLGTGFSCLDQGLVTLWNKLFKACLDTLICAKALRGERRWSCEIGPWRCMGCALLINSPAWKCPAGVALGSQHRDNSPEGVCFHPYW